MTNLQLVQLYAVRAITDALIAQAEIEGGAAKAVEPGSCPKCGAGPDSVQDRSTLDGTKRKRCLSCGEEWEG